VFSGLGASIVLFLALCLSAQAVDWRGLVCILVVLLAAAISLTIYPRTRRFGAGLLIGLVAGLLVACTAWALLPWSNTTDIHQFATRVGPGPLEP
jgi:hypothetical protein